MSAFTDEQIIERLEVLWRKLEDEGRYVSANTVELAIERFKELIEDDPGFRVDFHK